MNSLATTHRPIACGDCRSAGLTVEQCAQLKYSEHLARYVLANHDLHEAQTTREKVDAGAAKSAAKSALKRLESINRKAKVYPSTRVAIVGTDGIPLVVLDRSSATFKRHLADDTIVERQPGVYHLIVA